MSIIYFTWENVDEIARRSIVNPPTWGLNSNNRSTHLIALGSAQNLRCPTCSSVTLHVLTNLEGIVKMSSKACRERAHLSYGNCRHILPEMNKTRCFRETRVFPRLRMFSTRLTVAEEPRGRALYGLARSPPLTSQPSRIIPPFLLSLPPPPPPPQ